MSTIKHTWHTTTPPAIDVYITRKNGSKYQTLRYWDGERWWQIEWTRSRHQQPFTWPKKSRTRFPSGMSRYRVTMGLRRVNDQGVIQWSEPYRVFDEKEVLDYLVKSGRLLANWRTAFQDEMRLAKKGGA